MIKENTKFSDTENENKKIEKTKKEISKTENRKNENLKFEIAVVVKRNLRFITQRQKSLDEIISHLNSKGFTLGQIHKVLSNPFTLKSMKNEEIVLFLEQFYAKTGIFELNPLNWYESKVLRRAKNHDVQSSYEYLFKNVQRISSKSFIAITDFYTLNEFMENNMLVYDGEVASFLELENINTDSSSSIIDTKEIERIYNSVKESSVIYANVIELNVRDIYAIDVFNDGNKTLKIKSEDNIHVLKGFSYLLAFKQLLQVKDVRKRKFMLVLNFLSKSEEREYLKQL